MLNVGAPKTEVQLTISAELKGDMTEEQETAIKPDAGMTESMFQPEAPCTRGHIVTFIYRVEAAK